MTREAGEKNGPKGSQVCNEENPEDCLPVHCSLIRCMTILEHGICHHDILLDSTWSERDLENVTLRGLYMTAKVANTSSKQF